MKGLILRSMIMNFNFALKCAKFKCSFRMINTSYVEKDGVYTVILNNAKMRNALSLDTLRELNLHFTRDVNRNSLRCFVLKAIGPVFSSGHNLKELAVESNVADTFKEMTTLMLALRSCPVPIVAAVDGLAAAAGCQLVAACDMAICTENSTFSTPGANVGIFCSTPGIALSRRIPSMFAARMLFTGRAISSREALQMGLICKVSPQENFEEDTAEITKDIKGKSRSVIELGKKFFYRQLEMDLRNAYCEGEQTMIHNLFLKDGCEGLTSFLEKRKPRWSH